MNKPPLKHEEKLAIEKCIRSFLIKSIHTIVQARNGIVCNTNCVSEVGARNNMMVYVEEDPEIGATIKQTLDAGCPIRVQDMITLEILTQWPKEPHMSMVVEVWQFQLDIADKINRPSGIHDTHIPVSHAPAGGPHAQGDGSQSTEIAVDDFRHLRLFEKLGTLLKSIMVVTRLLPGYQLSRRQDPSDYQMCYTLRRGPSDLTRLGSAPKSYQVGCIFSGLAVAQPCVDRATTTTTTAASTPPTTPPDPPKKSNQDTTLPNIGSGLVPVFLGATVHYRTQFQYGPSMKLIPIVEGLTNMNLHGRSSSLAAQEVVDASCPQGCDLHSLNTKKPHKHVRVALTPTKTIDTSLNDNLGVDPSRLTSRVKPAFAMDPVDTEPDELFDPASTLLGRKSAERLARRYTPTGMLEPQEEDSEIPEEDYDEPDSDDSPTGVPAPFCLDEHTKHRYNSVTNEDPGPLLDRPKADDLTNEEDRDPTEDHTLNNPLQLPFSTVGASGSRLTHLFADLREHATLDLFQVPSNIANSVSASPGNLATTTQSSLFDADALADELERHERKLKEFDDFLSDFNSIEPFGLAGAQANAAATVLLTTRSHPVTEM